MGIKVYSLPKEASKPLVYVPSFMDLIAAIQLDIAEAKARVRVNPYNRKYSYEPSQAYKRYLNKHLTLVR